MKTTYVTIKISDDQHDRPWWEALGLPAPHYWNLSTEHREIVPGPHFPAADVFAATVMEVEER